MINTTRTSKSLVPQAIPAAFLALVLFAWPAVAANDAKTSESVESTAADATDDLKDGLTVEEAQRIIEERVTVVGDFSEISRLPGSAHVLSSLELMKFDDSDIHRILRKVPGINIQEEDGFGLRPNIGIRGTGVERSQKITLLEDGVLIAPAPYAAPSAYYMPTAGRMEGIEVRKGSAAIQQGPYTNGGAINMISRSIPGNQGGSLELFGGSHGTAKLDAVYGGSWERFGFMVETFQHRSDGFKDLDGGGSTGFELNDYLVKARFNTRPGNAVYQELEIKLGHTDQDGNETYIGLTDEDFAATPFRRYAGSQFDNILSEHEQVQLRHFVYFKGFDLTTTVYRNNYFRNWYKNQSVAGVSTSKVLADPQTYFEELAILRGDTDGDLKLRANRRDYYSQGIQSVLAFELGKSISHNFKFGARVHEDEEDRFQEEDTFAMVDGRMSFASAGAPGSNANRIGQAEAFAFFVEDRMELGKWTITPGLRFESIDLQRFDYGKADPTRSGVSLKTRENHVEELIPGLGISYQKDENWSVFGSAHRGFSPPGPSTTEDVDPETSVNYELGVRYDRGSSNAEVIGFWNDYSNLLGNDTLSTGGTGSGDLFNGGEVTVYGIEATYGRDLYQSTRFAVPVRATYTYTHGEFDTSFETKFADWAPMVVKGDEIPYVPEHQVFAEIGLLANSWSVFLSANSVAEMRTHAGQGAIPEDESIEAHTTFDLAGKFTVGKRYNLHLQVRNLTDEVYVAARRPYGLRPGLSRTVLVGLTLDF
jgi:Fe(3+) dicitrate transport protein